MCWLGINKKLCGMYASHTITYIVSDTNDPRRPQGTHPQFWDNNEYQRECLKTSDGKIHYLSWYWCRIAPYKIILYIESNFKHMAQVGSIPQINVYQCKSLWLSYTGYDWRISSICYLQFGRLALSTVKTIWIQMPIHPLGESGSDVKVKHTKNILKI